MIINDMRQENETNKHENHQAQRPKNTKQKSKKCKVRLINVFCKTFGTDAENALRKICKGFVFDHFLQPERLHEYVCPNKCNCHTDKNRYYKQYTGVYACFQRRVNYFISHSVKIVAVTSSSFRIYLCTIYAYAMCGV